MTAHQGWRAVGLLVLVPLVLLIAGTAQAAPRPLGVAPPHVVVVAAPGLRWSDVDATHTPTLQRLATSAAVGALSVKAGPSVSCPADGLLTLGAGGRATAYGVPCAGATTVAAQRERNARSREAAHVGALGDAVTSAGGCTAADGGQAALAAADGQGRVAPARRDPPPGALPQAGPAGLVLDCALVVLPAPAVGAAGAQARSTEAAAVDALVGAVEQARPAGSTLLVVGVSEAPGDDVAHLHVALATGPGLPPGALVSPSTGRAPYVQLVDVAPTVLQVLGLPRPAGMTGQPWRSEGAAPTVRRLVDLDRRAVAQKAVTVPFFVVLMATQLVLLGLLRHRRRLVELVALAGTAAPAASLLAGLLPWWRADPPLPALFVVAAVFDALLVAAARVGPWRRTRLGPLGAVCALTVLVLVADLVTGGALQVTSVTGYSPLVAGRFTGLGNVAFGVYAATGLVATAWLARGRAAVVALVGLVLVVVDGAPGWGSDVGGVLALLPALVVLGLLVSGRRVSVGRLAAAGAAAVAVVATFALVDAARPSPDRGHLGRFVGQLRDGSAGAVLQRKAEAVLGLLFFSPVTALLPLVVAGAVYLLVRPPPALRGAFHDVPAYRQALLALCVAAGLGFVLNDSGAAVPALALVVVLPATVAVVSSGAGATPDR